MGGDDVIFFGAWSGLGVSVMLDAVFSVTVVANGDGSVPRRVRVTEQGSYRRGWAAGKTRRPAWRAAPALSFLTCDLAFSGGGGVAFVPRHYMSRFPEDAQNLPRR